MFVKPPISKLLSLQMIMSLNGKCV